MINPQWLELPISRTNFHGPKEAPVIKVRLYKVKRREHISQLQKDSHVILLSEFKFGSRTKKYAVILEYVPI